jgi:hypothetical protein
MARKDPWLEHISQIVLAIGTAIVAIDILVGWLTGAFSRDSLSGTVSAIVLNSVLALIAAIATAAAVFYWRKERDLRRSVIAWLESLLPGGKRPEGPPLIPDVSDAGYPPLSNLQLTGLYGEARVMGERSYSDAKLCAVAIVSAPHERPSIQAQFDFYSEHAGKVAEVYWDNYSGFAHTVAGVDPQLVQKRGGWEAVPWDMYPDWDKFYRLAYEKVQPLREPPVVILSSSFDEDRWPWFFHFESEPNSPCYALTTDGQLVQEESVYSLKIALLRKLGRGLGQRSGLSRTQTNGIHSPGG